MYYAFPPVYYKEVIAVIWKFLKVVLGVVLAPAVIQTIIEALKMLLNKEYLKEYLTEREKRESKRKIYRFIAVIIILMMINNVLDLWQNADKTYALPHISFEEVVDQIRHNIDFDNCSIEDVVIGAEYQVYTIEQLSPFSLLELRLIRNGIFARYGYVFEDEDLSNYYSQFDWYKPDYGKKITYSDLNKYQQKNIDLIKEIESWKRKYDPN